MILFTITRDIRDRPEMNDERSARRLLPLGIHLAKASMRVDCAAAVFQ